MQGQVYLQRTSRNVEEDDNDDDSLSLKYFILNKNMLYFLSDETYRNIEEGIELKDIPNGMDNVRLGECCDHLK